MAAGKCDLSIEQGATFRTRLTIKAGSPATVIDLTGYTAKMQFRAAATSTSPVIMTVSSGTAPPATGLTLGGSAGTIDILIAAADTDPITATRAVYDLEITAPNGDVTRVLKGSVLFDPEVTR